MITLSTPSEQLVRELYEEKPKALYWHEKQTATRSRENELFERYASEKAELGNRFIAYETEYKSRSGNRWFVFDVANVTTDGKMVLATISFIYYETFGSIGCFMPASHKTTAGMPAAEGASIFTSHFFLRYCERTGIQYRSRKMIQQFATDILGMIGTEEKDKDGEEQFAYRIPGKGIIKARRRKDSPLVVEMRTFYSDAMLTPSMRKRYADALGMSDSEGFRVVGLINRYLKQYVKESKNTDIMEQFRKGLTRNAGYDEKQAYQYMQLISQAIGDMQGSEVGTILRGMTLAVSTIVQAFEHANPTQDDSLRRMVHQWLDEPDLGIPVSAGSVAADITGTASD